jgi:drug/metabolite transporter (DMT)-like permease
MIWFLFAVLSPILFACSNIFDNDLTNLHFKKVPTLVYYSSLFNTLFLPIIFLIQRPSALPIALIPAALVIGAIEIFYLFPYYAALRRDDTSVVISLFSLGKLFVPLLAFLFVHEALRPIQYAGFALIVFGGAFVSLNHGRRKKIKLNIAFVYMLICSLLLSIEAILYKYLFETVSWSTGLTWSVIFSFIFALSFWLIPKWRPDIIKKSETFIHELPLFLGSEFFTFAGTATATFAVSIGSVTLTQGIDSFQPFFVLLYALILERFLPKVFKERIDRKSLIRKFFWFLVMVGGVVLAL